MNPMTRPHLAALLLVVLTSTPALAEPPEDLLTAMEVSMTDCYNITSTGQDIQRATLPSLGIVSPQYGASMAFLAAGQCPNIHDCIDYSVSPGAMGQDDNGYSIYDLVTLEMDCDVPTDANSLGFTFYFFSREYPDYVGSSYNDAFKVNLTSAAWNGNIVFDGAGNVISVNNALFTVTNQALLQGTGFDCGHRGGGTGWLTTIAPVVPEETIHLEFEIYDCSDGVYDSAVLLDDFYWSETDPKSPTTGHPVELWFLTPKEGPLAGGQEVTIYGKNFTNDTRIYFETTQVGATVIDSGRMRITTPAWDEAGLLDVMAANPDFEAILEGAYTYQAEGSEGQTAPELFYVDPEYGLVEGGEPVVVHGEHFAEGAITYFGGVEAQTTFVSAEELQAITPPGEEGTVEVVVFNADGQYTEPIYYFTYYADESDAPEIPVDDDDDDDCSCSADGRSVAPAAGLVGALAALTLIRRRR
jgi:hypothetical protein